MGSCLSKELPPTTSTPNTGTTGRQNQKQALDKHAAGDEKVDKNKLDPNANKDKTNGTVVTSNGAAGTASASPTTENTESAGASKKKEVKVLLLGSGESGKSTIVKQMKILHQNGYSKEELIEYKPFVYKNILDCIKTVLNAIMDLQPDLVRGVNGEDEKNENAVIEYSDLNAILQYDIAVGAEEELNPGIAAKIKAIYNTSEVKHFIRYEQGNFYLIDSTDYFLSDLDRITQPKYIPLVLDILRTRKKTSGIFDFKFDMGNGLKIHMYDVGGQRSERKKWIHCFDNVTLIIFCVALSEYDQVLLEENSQNRMEESLTLFDSVINSRWFSRTSVVLFLNKIDVFAEKIPYLPLEAHFPDYTGGNNINKAAKYILWRFTQVNRSGLNIYPHVTQATDTLNIELVFAAVKETILENLLRDLGIL